MGKSNKLFFLKDYISNKNIQVGTYSYLYTFKGEKGAQEFQNFNVLYHFPDIYNDWLRIGNYCAIADDVKFLMNGANHRIETLSTFPFELFKEFEHKISIKNNKEYKDTIVGHDVWIGNNVMVLPGIEIGNGSIIGAGSVVTKDVKPYSIVAGNPAKFIRMRIDDEKINYLENLKWWDKPINEIKELINDLTNINSYIK
ncbi:acetyltransferase [Spiroplasma corruscae]|uniref:Acetyltransferase n=1 Tax=Spiroplasma corruscae TaxID=216934 RepID=A0A222ENR9_9MOLU|nr:CatB-related O-acetyltransferase [Spiroplasma corruscae]ASP28138.1 acetyltransferase [Spiroplasma corruscae]